MLRCLLFKYEAESYEIREYELFERFVRFLLVCLFGSLLRWSELGANPN